MEWWTDDSGKMRHPCSGGLMTMEGGGFHAVVG